MLKIIAGQFKGRHLSAPHGLETRPTGILARKMLFDMLLADKKWGRDMSQAKVIDICAGTGSLGLEALSRGAQKLLLIESSPPAIASIQHNIKLLQAEKQTSLLAQKIQHGWHSIPQEFLPSDIIFADPPYQNTDLLNQIIHGVVNHQLLSPRGYFVLQLDPKNVSFNGDDKSSLDIKIHDINLLGLKIIDQRRTGKSMILFLQLA